MRENFGKRLYQLSFTDVAARRELYFKTKAAAEVTADSLFVPAGGTVDLLTYFNSFSLKQWKKYTSIENLLIKGCLNGRARIDVVGVDSSNGDTVIASFETDRDFNRCFDVADMDCVLLGLNITAIDDCRLTDIAYYGEFASWRDLKIGVAICTFWREEYVRRTMAKLIEFSKGNSYLSTLVVDNGATLPLTDSQSLRIVHNPNYGGSGGFTRGLIENLARQDNDYVLLMDDDIDLDPLVLTKTHSLLGGLKPKYQDSFLAGAMLKMEKPCIQHENTAYWRKILSCPLGEGWDLTDRKMLLANEAIGEYRNQYAAWWYACLPLKRVAAIGLPLPVFIKGDDIEYSIRNDRPVIHLNGIGVWHKSFAEKKSRAVNYFWDRNGHIIHHYIADCNRLTFVISVVCRLLKRSLEGKKDDIAVMELALKDVRRGFEELTKMPADKYFAAIRDYRFSAGGLACTWRVLKTAIKIAADYSKIHRDYVRFREDKLMDSKWWLDYLAKAGRANEVK